MRRSGARQAARRYLELQVARVSQSGRQRLPTLATMAGEAGVGSETMAKTVAEFVAAGILDARRGRGIILAQPETCHVQAQSTSSSRERILDRLRKEILSGRYMPGTTLPSMRRLSLSMGVGCHTVRAALKELVSAGLVEMHGPRATVARFAHGASDHQIALVAWSRRGTAVPSAAPSSLLRMQALERVCSSSGVRLVLAPYDVDTQKIDGLGRRDLARSATLAGDRTLGYIVWALNLDQPTLRAITDLAAARRVPMAILDETGEITPSMFALRGPLVRMFTVSCSVQDGRRVGHYLLMHRHRRIAVVSHDYETAWAQRRVEGLEQVLRESGTAQPLYRARLTFDPERVPKAANLLTYVRKHSASLARFRNTWPIDADISRSLVGELLLQEAIGRLLPSRDDVLRFTAWVGLNDPLAVALRRHFTVLGLRVPGDISLVGFDNSLESTSYRFTSHDPGTEEVARALVAHVLGPAARQPVRRAVELTETVGHVAERGTVATIR